MLKTDFFVFQSFGKKYQNDIIKKCFHLFISVRNAEFDAEFKTSEKLAKKIKVRKVIKN